MQIKVIEPKQRIKAKIRVCAYCRVSTEADEQENSLTNQKEYYENLIRSNPSYEYVDVYLILVSPVSKKAVRDSRK